FILVMSHFSQSYTSIIIEKNSKGVIYSDIVQNIYCFNHDFSALPIQLTVGSGHKIHNPKGIGFVYIEAALSVEPLIYGGSQELNRRSGIAHLLSIKKHMIALLSTYLPDVIFNGHSADLIKSSPTPIAFLSASIQPHEEIEKTVEILRSKLSTPTT
ncbi:MAG: aminotransferase class V-fold PLP-dependent enzyme, partial [Candidatus Cardinium sp.]|nr:aminotransferase class V-fold PLP-dependent enzyme [Candidatus Cardinium sp.]